MTKSREAMSRGKNLLLFNLKTDADDDVLGFTTDWVNGLAASFERVFVVTMVAGRVAVANNVEVFSVGKEKGYTEARRVVEFYRIVGGLLARHPIHACFAHMIPEFAVLGAPLLKIRGIPLALWYTHKSVTPMLRVATVMADRVLTAIPESFRLASPKVRAIGHGIDTRKFEPRPDDGEATAFRILTVGRLSPVKRVDLLLDAVAQLRRRRPELQVRVRVVGQPLGEAATCYEAELKAQVLRLELDGVVEFLGSVPFQEVVPQYQQADCFVNLSETGGLDKAILEAMSCGVPVVTPSGMCAQVLGAELGAAWAVDGDAAQVCDRLERLAFMAPAERQALGARLRAIVERDHELGTLCDRVVSELGQLA